MDKLAFGKTMAPEPPQAQQNNVQEWRKSLDNACAQLEHQHNWWGRQCACVCMCVRVCASILIATDRSMIAARNTRVPAKLSKPCNVKVRL